MYERRRLIGDCARDARVCVSERAHGDPRDEVEVAIPRLIEQIDALAAHDVDLRTPVVPIKCGCCVVNRGPIDKVLISK